MVLDPFQSWVNRWNLVVDGSTISARVGNQLLPVVYRGEPAMLKIAIIEEEQRGAALMEWYGGIGAARTLAREGEALLLERLTGSRSLAMMAATGDDDEAVRTLCDTVARLHAPRPQSLPHNLVPLTEWFQALALAGRTHGGFFATSAAAANDLLKDPREIVVLRGDFHHDNVLDGGLGGGWRLTRRD